MDGKEIIDGNIEECKLAHQSDTYFDMAERYMDMHWRDLIWPHIKSFDFTRVLELAPGYGRNTERLLEHSKEIHLVDVNQSCIDKCKKRFANYKGKCKLFYYVNDGKNLSEIPSDSITFIYSWDSMVHFDKLVMKEYIKEFERVLAPGGKGFVHHSNYGVVSQSNDWQNHPAWRSNMTKELFYEYAAACNLDVYFQRVIDWELKDMDCISLFRKT